MGNIESNDNLMTKVDYEENYHSQRHKDHFNENYYMARAKIALFKFFKRVDTKSRILDYGCGLGQNIYHLPNAFGYDISQYCIDFCRSKGIKVTRNIDDYENESFDLVFSSHVLEHHPNPKNMIAEMYQKLKPKHDLILVIPFERHGKAQFELDLNQHLYNWNFQNINNLLITSGFKIKTNKYIRGAGYSKLLKLRDFNFQLYYRSTILLSYLAGIKEMMIVAQKI